MARYKPQQIVGRFEIEGELGRGGFAEVYIARDTKLQRKVAIKCLREDLLNVLGGDAGLMREFEARFAVEGRAQARLSHPNACTIFDFYDEDQIIVMEWIDGLTLEKLRTGGALPKEELIDIVIAAAEAIDAAHDHKVLHRDITLKNIMVTGSNRVKVLDFGLAKLMDEEPFTRFAGAMGTARYMSPEQQLRPSSVDKRSDVFSFGVAIFRLVTGHFPYKYDFKANPDPGAPPPFGSYGVDPWHQLNIVVRNAVQLPVADRYQSMKEMLGELKRVRQRLSRVECTIHFFDTSTLFEVVCPPVPTKTGRHRAERAKQQFEVHHSSESAVTSASVLSELLDRVLRLYFEASGRGLSRNRLVRQIVRAAKRRIRSRLRGRGVRDRRLSWEKLRWDDKLFFLGRVKHLFQETLDRMASQLAAVETDGSVVLPRFFDFAIGCALFERDARVLAEAFSMRAKWLFSEEARLRGPRYQKVLEPRGPNSYVLKERGFGALGSPTDTGAPSMPALTASV